jgi:biotin synthase
MSRTKAGRHLFGLVDKLERERRLSKGEYASLIEGRDAEVSGYLFEKSRRARERSYGDAVYIRGLVEFTNCCKNDCLYCGIRRSNARAERYRLEKEEILSCCDMGHALGFRTFVLQGGDDGFFTDDVLVDIVRSVKSSHPDCAITLSVGERCRESYRRYYEAGADRYLLRHETANAGHYGRLHPAGLLSESRKRCLRDLKGIGFQTGSGFMVGSPFQTAGNLAEDMLFLHELRPHMVGVGPFMPHRDPPFADPPSGTAELTLFMLGLVRLALPSVLLPATTALGTVSSDGWERGVLAGANVVMLNLSPKAVRKKYLLYDNKPVTEDDAAESRASLEKRMERIGCRIEEGRGDYRSDGYDGPQKIH